MIKLKNTKLNNYLFYIVFLLSILFSLINIYLYFSYSDKVYILGTSDNLQSKKIYWINLIKENPTYFEGWIQLALIENRLGDKASAVESLNKAREIDPNSEILNKVEQTINN